MVIILAFLVLLTGLAVAFFSRAITERQVSNSSASQTKADLLARSCADLIIADLKQEIAAGSTAYSPVAGVTIYTPTADPTGAATPPVLTSSVVPWVSGVPTPSAAGSPFPIPNLIRRSVRASDSSVVAYPSIYVNPPPNRASAVNSTANPSTNGRAVSPAEWNAHYLMPTAGTTNSAPVASFVAPDWVMVTTGGPKVLTAPDPMTIGRYAYAIYDEGGLLDANVAGCPSTVTSNSAYADPKGFAAFADLTALGLSSQQADKLIGWRNYATTKPTGSLAAGYVFGSPSATSYFSYVLGQTSGFLAINSNDYSPGTTPGTFTSAPMTFGTPAQMDQAFADRQSLIKFWNAAGIDKSLLQYFGTFTRDLNQPNFVPLANPAPPTGLNPPLIINYPTPTASTPNPAQSPVPLAPVGGNPVEPNPIVQNVLFPSNSSSSGAPVVSQRFSLGRIALLSSPSANAAAIKHYFGLTLGSDGYSWTYTHGGATGTIMSLAQLAGLAAARDTGYPNEPDFFECLQAAVLYGSLGNYSGNTSNNTIPVSTTTPVNGYASGSGLGFNGSKASQFCTTIIQMGANLIDQYDADNLPTVVNFAISPTLTLSFAGIENLPYFSEVLLWPYRPVTTTPANAPQGGMQVGDSDRLNLAAFAMFELWNPHQNATNISTGKSPMQLRVKVQAGTVDNTIYVTPTSPNKPAPVPTPAPVPLPPQLPVNSTVHVTFNNATSFQEPTLLGVSNGAASPENDWFQVTDQSPPRSGLLLGVGTLIDYDLNGGTNKNLYRYQTIAWDTSASQGNPIVSLEFTLDGTNWLTYEGSPISPGAYAIGMSEGQLTAVVNKPSPFGPQVTNDVSWSVYTNIGSTSSQVSDPRTKSSSSLFIGQSTYGLSIRPGAPGGTSGNLSGAAVDRYEIINPFNYTFPIYGSGWNMVDYNNNSNPAYLGMYNENADNNISHYHLSNVYMSANAGAYDTYLVDPDGVERPGDGFYGGNPFPAGNTASMASRPLILNRPFRSVGEMGYANRGYGVWKNVNFSSPQSADAGLLDYFSIDSAPISAGKVNLNTRQPQVLQAMLQGAYRIEQLGSTTVDALTASDAGTIANAIVNHTMATTIPSPMPAPPYIPGPLVSRADLVRSLLGDPAIIKALNGIQGTAGTDPANTAKTRREALVRALADVGTTRTWNLLIDLVAQTGVYPTNATGLSNFVVQGEKHYWVHVALDRYTGTVIDQQLELVNN